MRRTLLVVIVGATFLIWVFAVLHLPRRSGPRRALPGLTGAPPETRLPEGGPLPARVRPAPARADSTLRPEGAARATGAAANRPPADPGRRADPPPAAAASNPEAANVAGQRRAAVRAAMRHSWGAYRRHAWGHDELNPLTKTYTDWRCQPDCAFALTMIDGLDTLWVMGLKEEFAAAVRYIAVNVTFDRNAKVSVFETIIRLLGGLLSAYDLSHEAVLLQRAVELGQRLLPAFHGTFPAPLVNLQTGQAEHWTWTPSLILAEVASLQLEFSALSDRSKQETFDAKGTAILQTLQQTAGPQGLLPTMLTQTGLPASNTYSIGAFGDSAYEYLLKLWVLNGDSRALEMFRAAKTGIKRSLLIRTPNGVAVGVSNAAQLNHEVEHLTCFAGGMFALAHHYGVGESDDLATAEGIAAFCHHLHTTPTGLPPDTAFLQDGGTRVTARDAKYILRPETVETYFYLWRITHKPIYRDWGWALFEACERYLKVDGGYAGMRNVYAPTEGLNDKMESFWLAETLKYMFLLFSEDSVISLEDYVFNTEGHPLRRSRTPKPAN